MDKHNLSQTLYNVCIIGSGMAGMAAAQTLAEYGVENVILLDKGRSVGGRFATRRMDGGIADHGAQFISAHTNLFRNWAIERWLTDRTLRVWFSKKGDKFVARNGMNEWMKRWSSQLPEQYQVLPGIKVERIEEQKSEWLIIADEGFTVRAKTVIVTAPLPQALALTKNLQDAWDVEDLQRLVQVEYDPCLALLISLDGSSAVPAPGYYRNDLPSPIAWVADNLQKGISERTILTVHLRGDWSETHYDDQDEHIVAEIMPLMQRFIDEKAVLQVQVKRWRYALAKHLYPAAHFSAPNKAGIFLAGDAFSIDPAHPPDEQGRAETACLSGVSAAKQLLLHYPNMVSTSS